MGTAAGRKGLRVVAAVVMTGAIWPMPQSGGGLPAVPRATAMELAFVAKPAEPAPPAPPSSGGGARPPSLSLSPAPATPEPPADPAAAALAARVAAATDRAVLLDLLGAGAEFEQVTARLSAIGYLPVAAGAVRVLRRPGDGESFSDCADCPELVLAPAGEARMQIAIGPTPKTVVIPIPTPFAVGRHEVTRGQFHAFASASGYVQPPGCYERSPAWKLDLRLGWRDPGYAQTDDHPAACISLLDARAYVAWLSRKTGQRYRLLSDAEWHHLAARIQIDPAGLCKLGNGADETARQSNPDWTVAPCNDGFLYTAPVGRFAASDWGLSDLNGNLWEWVETCAPDAAQPDQPFPPPSCSDNAARILRGGSWADPPSLRTLDSRIISAPDIRDQVAGFRIAREMLPP